MSALHTVEDSNVFCPVLQHTLSSHCGALRPLRWCGGIPWETAAEDSEVPQVSTEGICCLMVQIHFCYKNLSLCFCCFQTSGIWVRFWTHLSFPREREQMPHFAQPGTFEFEYSSRWKALDEMEKQQREQVDKNIKEAKEKLEAELESAKHEHQLMLMRHGKGCLLCLFSSHSMPHYMLHSYWLMRRILTLFQI